MSRFANRPTSPAVLLVLWALANTASDAFVPIHRPRHFTGPKSTSFKPLILRKPAPDSTSRLYYIHRRKARSGPDYYAILEVSKTANKKDIKSAYRRLAKLYHPDANPGKQTAEQFQTISQAYEVLKDPALKKKYDLEVGNYAAASQTATATSTATPPRGTTTTRTAGTRSRAWSGDSYTGWTSSSSSSTNTNTNPAGWTSSRGSTSSSSYSTSGFYSSPNDHFYTSGVDGFRSSPFSEGTTTKKNGHASDYYTKRRNWSSRGPVPGDDLRFDLEIDLKTAMFGGDQEIRIRHLETCRPCNGKGINEGDSPNSWRACSTCGGKGSTPESTQTPLGTFHSQQVCSSCRGTGRERIGSTSKAEDYCTLCDAQGITSKPKRIKVTIPPNVKDGNKLLIRGEGDAGFNGGPAGDLYIYISVRQQATYTAPPSGNYGATNNGRTGTSSWGQYSSGPSKSATSGANFDNFYSPNWNDEEFFSVNSGSTVNGFHSNGATNGATNSNGSSQTDNNTSTKSGSPHSTSNGATANNGGSSDKNPDTVTDKSGTSYTKNSNIYGPDDISDNAAKKDGFNNNRVSYGSRYGRDYQSTWSSGASVSDSNGAKANASSKNGASTQDTNGATYSTNNSAGAGTNNGVDGASVGSNNGASTSNKSTGGYNRAHFSVDEGVSLGGRNVAGYGNVNGVNRVSFNGFNVGTNNVGTNNGASYSPPSSPGPNIGNNPFNNRANFGFTSGASVGNTNSANYSPSNGFSNGATSGYSNGATTGNNNNGARYSPTYGYTNGASVGNNNGARYGTSVENNNGARYGTSVGNTNGATAGNNNGAQYSPSNGYTNGASVGNNNGARYSPSNGYTNGASVGNNNGAKYSPSNGYTNGASVGNNNGAKYSPSNGYTSGSTKAVDTTPKMDDPFFVNGVGDLGRNSSPGRAWTRGPVVGSDLVVSVEVDLKKAIGGGEEKLTFGHLVTCDGCFGSGAKRGTKKYMCSNCGGSGCSTQSLGGSIPSPQQTPCGHCRGTGLRFQEGCDVCSGRGLKPVSREIKVVIPPGAEEGNQLYVQGEGDAGPNGGPPGDLYINLKVRY